MKRYLYFPIIILSMFIALTGCSSDDDTPNPPVVRKGFTPLASADSWFVNAKSLQDQGYDPQVMVVIFSLENLPVDYADCSTDDVAAAFVGDQCRYAVSVQTLDGKKYGSVVMYRVDSDEGKPVSFSIRYYSEKLKGYFTSNPITFATNETLGTLSAPAKLSWILE